MSNVIQIKRGHGAPQAKNENDETVSLLYPYELGYDVDSNTLYIGQETTKQAPLPISGGIAPIICKKSTETLPDTLTPGQLLVVYEEVN